MKRLVHLHHYRALLRSLFIAVFIGVAAALAVWLFHRSMIGLEWLLLGNADGSLVAAAAALPGWRRALTRRWAAWRRACCCIFTSATATSARRRPPTIWKRSRPATASWTPVPAW